MFNCAICHTTSRPATHIGGNVFSPAERPTLIVTKTREKKYTNDTPDEAKQTTYGREIAEELKACGSCAAKHQPVPTTAMGQALTKALK